MRVRGKILRNLRNLRGRPPPSDRQIIPTRVPTESVSRLEATAIDQTIIPSRPANACYDRRPATDSDRCGDRVMGRRVGNPPHGGRSNPRAFLYLPGLLFALASPAVAQTPAGGEPRRVPPTELPIKVDGVIDEAAWTDALSIALAVETEPGENVAPPVETECLLTYDRGALYVAFRARDPEPGKIRARLADRDTVESDDHVGVVLDTFNDARRAFGFFVNPRGVQMDRSYDDVTGNRDPSWDAIWSSAGRVDGAGYQVEMAIPFSSLRFPRTPGPHTWGIDAVRSYPRNFSHRLANNPLDRDVECYLCQLDKVSGFEGASPGRNVELDPTLTAGRSDLRRDFPDGPIEQGDEDVEVGLTARWGITPNLDFGAAVNPDFSQVEADVAQLDVNEQFALFFPERRPFFLEGADLFETQQQIVFTRNVADPAWGVKLTGKEGKNAHAVFVARDELTNLLFPGSQGSDAGSFDFETTNAALRYRRDVGESSVLGAVATYRGGGDYSNLVLGVDGLLRITDADSIRFQALGSRTEYPAAVAEDFGQPSGSFDGENLLLAYDRVSRDWEWSFQYRDVSEDFRADLGFMPRVDFSILVGGVERNWWGAEGAAWSERSLGFQWDRLEDQAGRLIEEEWEIYADASGPKQSYLFLGAGIEDRVFGGVTFEDDTFFDLYFEFQPRGDLYFTVIARVADAIDFANVRPGDELVVAPELRYDFGDHLRLSLSHTLSRLDVAGGRLFQAELTESRLIYQFNLRTFVRAIVQYTDVERDPALFPGEVEPESEELFTQLLFSYKINPRTVLFLGYSDDAFGGRDFGLTRENRAFFFKLGYAWVL